MVIWTLNLAIRKGKISILKLKMAKNAKMQVLGAKSSKMTAPNFGSNSLFGPSTVFNENRQTKGGTPQDTPRSDNLQHRQPFEAPNDNFEVKICRLEAKKCHFAIKTGDSDAKNNHLETKIGPFTKNVHLDAKFGHSQTKNKHFEAQNGQKCQNAGFGGQIFQNDSPQFFGQILYLGLVPFSTKIAKPRGGPHKTPQEATICNTGSRLKLQMTVLKLKFAVWKLKIAIWKRQRGLDQGRSGGP